MVLTGKFNYSGSYFFFKKRCLSLVGVAYFGPTCGLACIVRYRNLLNPSMFKPFMKFTFSWLVELVLLNLCIKCLTEFLKIRTCFKIVG